MKQTTRELLPLSFRAAVGQPDAEARRVDVTWSTGAEVMRRDPWTGERYLESLSMDPKHVRLERLNGGASVLDSHSSWSVADVLGATVEGSARIENGVGIETLQFSDRSAVDDIWRDITKRILRWVSIGYLVHAYRDITEKGDQVKRFLAIDWEPYETSLVAMPADAGASVRAADKSLAHPCVVITDGRDIEDADRMRRFRLALKRGA